MRRHLWEFLLGLFGAVLILWSTDALLDGPRELALLAGIVMLVLAPGIDGIRARRERAEIRSRLDALERERVGA